MGRDRDDWRGSLILLIGRLLHGRDETMSSESGLIAIESGRHVCPFVERPISCSHQSSATLVNRVHGVDAHVLCDGASHPRLGI